MLYRREEKANYFYLSFRKVVYKNKLPDLNLINIVPFDYQTPRIDTRSAGRIDRSGDHGPYLDSGDSEYCRCDQRDSQYRHHPSVHQLRRHLHPFFDGGDGNGIGRIKPHYAGTLTIRNT